VETDRACEVAALGHRARTFEVAGHYYALVVADDLRPGSEHEYQVALDGAVRWPEPGSPFPPSTVRTPRDILCDGGRDGGRAGGCDGGRGPVRLAFGSCRVARARVPRMPDRPDALAAFATRLRQTPRDRWPDALLMIGDQVYADNPGPATREFIGQRRDQSKPPGYEVADFAEYCRLYREAWCQPAVRWLLSVIPTAMIFDDHDFHDDWNTSAAWRREYTAKPWWRSRITGAYLSYWLYQHLGNLSPEELGKDEVWRQVRESGDAAAVLTEFAVRADERAAGIRWSFHRDFGGVRVVVIDSRSRRVLDPGGRRMADEAEWRWVTQAVSGDWQHVVLATSLPLLLPRGIDALEAWNEAVCDGAWGRLAARAGEWLRRAVDLEHWAAFRASFADFETLLAGVAAGAHGTPPASITIISGDVHNNYLAPADLSAVSRPAVAESATPRSVVYQVVCSPFHHVLSRKLRAMYWLGMSRAGEIGGVALARLAGARRPRIRWRLTRGPWFENMICLLEFDGRGARARFDRAIQGEDGTPVLEPAATVFDHSALTT
jgi:hypothetical protein